MAKINFDDRLKRLEKGEKLKILVITYSIA
jgi:hypothetical protein